jgi:hypothetical protein
VKEKIEVKVGSIWRENDKRFLRYVRVVSTNQSKNGNPAAAIVLCDENGNALGRQTVALIKRFGTAYKLYKAAR